MARHFYRLARVLLGREKARDLRNDVSWFDAVRQTTASAAEEPVWEEILTLLEPVWHPLARGIRDAGLPVPADAYWDLMDSGRVTGQQALMVWHQAGVTVALVPEGVPVTMAGGPLTTVKPSGPM